VYLYCGYKFVRTDAAEDEKEIETLDVLEGFWRSEVLGCDRVVVRLPFRRTLLDGCFKLFHTIKEVKLSVS
jgi:hypothetical protein